MTLDFTYGGEVKYIVTVLCWDEVTSHLCSSYKQAKEVYDRIDCEGTSASLYDAKTDKCKLYKELKKCVYCCDDGFYYTAEELADYVLKNNEDGVDYDYNEWADKDKLTREEYRQIIRQGIIKDLHALAPDEGLSFYKMDVWKEDKI